MTPRQILFVSTVGIVFLVLVLELIRRHVLREKYSLIWLLIAAGVLSVPIMYGSYTRIATLFGIKDPTSLFFYSSIIGLLTLSLQSSVALSRAYQRAKVLVQQLALLENRVRQLEEAVKEKPASPS